MFCEFNGDISFMQFFLQDKDLSIYRFQDGAHEEFYNGLYILK